MKLNKKERRDRIVSTALEKTLAERFDKVCKKNKLTRSEALHQLIVQLVDEN